MPAEVESMVYTNAVPWHGEGTPIDHLMSPDEALRLSGLDYTVSLQPAIWVSDNGTRHETDTHIIVRDQTQTQLGSTGTRYRVIQNTEVFQVFSKLFDGVATVETAGVLRDGKLCWVLARLPEQWKDAAGDLHETYFAGLWGHTGLRSVSLLPTDTRVVCCNTYVLALGGEKDALERGLAVKITHNGDTTAKLENAAITLQQAFGIVKKHKEQLGHLLDLPLTVNRKQEFYEKHFNLESKQGQRAVEAIEHLRLNTVSATAGVAETCYGLWQGVTDYYDHAARQRGQSVNRMEYAMLGSGAMKKSQAWNWLVKEAA